MTSVDRPIRVAFMVWRDTTHPEGGGSEVYVEHMARALAATGNDVTVVCAAHAQAPPDEMRDGVRFRRRGGRLTVYPHALRWLASRHGRAVDVIVDVQNGLPFWSVLSGRRRDVVVLVHHVHRDQWHMIYPGWRGRVGWALESKVAPRAYRAHRYVTVSEASAADLAVLGINGDRVEIVRNGIDVPHPSMCGARSPHPTICVLGRLVPHKQVEHALHAVAALRAEIPTISLDVVGEGWWRSHLEELAGELGVDAHVRFHGHVPDATRDRLLDSAWIQLTPSLKEGWGIAIMEAAARAVPTVAYRSAGGVTESVRDGETGLLVSDQQELTAAARRLLTDHALRERLGDAARARAALFEWASSTKQFAALVTERQRTAQRLP
ncbi:MAG: glycosyltransferase family 4 protein [Jatrophihabitans sp.]